MKNKVDKLDLDKLLHVVPVDLSKLSDKVKNDNNSATNTNLNAKINEVKYKRPNITNLATTGTAVNAVENKMPVSNLTKKLTIKQQLMKLKGKLLVITVMINILLLNNLTN